MSEIKKIQFDMALEKVLSKEKRSDRSDNLESIEHSKRPEQICKKYYLPVEEYATNFAPQTMTPPSAITDELTLLTSRRKPKPQIIESNNDAENLQGSRVISQTVSSVEQNSHVTESVINDPENTTQNNPFKQLEMSKDLLMSTQKRQIVTSTPKAAKTPSIVETSKESSDIFNELACYQCKRNSSTGETERILILNLPDLKKTDVEQLIKNYFSTEIIDNWNCVKCSKNTSVHKRSKLVQSPQILIIHLNRFQKKNDYFQKNDIEIEFANHTIDLTNYGNTSENPKYELFGVIAHEGSMTQGHYMNYIKFNNLWFKFDDEKVSKVDENAVMSGAYVLYLRRLGTKTNKQ
uniref:USP domain-containing protein n=1 Tax=Panagrolaimus sp. JU765 TaxID=591449 RepID=A0AC34QW50_9BILA